MRFYIHESPVTHTLTAACGRCEEAEGLIQPNDIVHTVESFSDYARALGDVQWRTGCRLDYQCRHITRRANDMRSGAASV